MKFTLSLLAMLILFTACETNAKKQENRQPNIKKIVVKEVLQAGGYTYLLGLNKNDEKWFATTSFKAEIGKTYYFKNEMEMKDFESKELKRTFKSIYFVDKMSSDSTFVNAINGTSSNKVIPSDNTELNKQAAKPILEKENINIAKGEGIISVAELFKNKEVYANKIVKVKGKVTRFNPAILNKNWIHLQDGTEFQNNFDITATSNFEAKVGDIITLEGTVFLNKDFGAGYVYKVIIENAVLVK
jgi:hypothetical protein